MIRRLIVVHRNEVDLYDFIRRDNVGDDTVMVIADRRTAERRQRSAAPPLERRRAERRQHDIESLLVAQGWAEVRLATGASPRGTDGVTSE